jgi:D-serine deaminase-like pyridoxal phosphate-dependent protein
MIKSKYESIDTPAVLIDYDIMMKNFRFMQSKANQYHVNLRPHIKTHRMPELAKLQMKEGAYGITVAKVGEAEVMAQNGLNNIFSANEIVGVSKLERIGAIPSLMHTGIIEGITEVRPGTYIFSI